MMRAVAVVLLLLLLCGCAANRQVYSPAKKFSPAALQEDFSVYRSILEEAHPGLYWYTPKDSMDYYFEQVRRQLNDSMTEGAFRKTLTYATTKIRCGHTTMRSSKAASRYRDTSFARAVFPLNVKVWNDTAIVTANRFRSDSLLTRGTRLLSINDKPISFLVDTFFNYLSTDGYNTTHKYQSLSSGGYFGTAYTALFGFPAVYKIVFETNGTIDSTSLPPFVIKRDTSRQRAPAVGPPEPQPSRKERKKFRREAVRNLWLDSAGRYAVLELNSFSKGFELRHFFRESMRSLQKHHINHLIIDVRNNGGGSVGLSTLFTRYFADHRFKAADTLYAIAKRKKYSRYITSDWLNRLFLTFFTRKKQDGKYHFGFYERHHFRPKKSGHYNGKIIVLTSGNSFSATILFADIIKEQSNVLLVGEETGGGAYGNSAWLIPDVTLPNTKVRFRLPLFRLVIDKNAQQGRGIFPDVEVPPSTEAIRKNKDAKMEKSIELILGSKF